MKSQSSATQIITSNIDSGDGVFIGAETPKPHHSPPTMTTSIAATSTTTTQKGWSVTDAALVGASFAIALMLGGFAAQVVLDSPFVSGAHKQPIVVSLR